MKVKSRAKLVDILNSTPKDEQRPVWPGVNKWDSCLYMVEQVLVSADRALKLEDIVDKFKARPGFRVARDVSTVIYQLEKSGIVARSSRNGKAYFRVKPQTTAKNEKPHSGLPPYVSKKGKKFKARVSINGVLTTIGVFNTPEEAHNAAVLAKKQKTVTGVVQENTSIVPERNILDIFVLKIKKLFN